MDVLGHDPESPKGRRTGFLIALAALIIVLVAVVGVWMTLRQPAPPPKSAEVAKPVPSPAIPRPVPKETPTPGPERPVRPRTPPKPAAPEPEIVPAPPPSLALHVESDVPGAMVFVDRQYVGNTPVTTTEVTPGSHTLNVSAEGYQGYAGTVELTEGTKDVTVRFKEVRLNQSVAVVHKHAIGSCAGRLVADVRGIRYETSNRDDAFTVPFARLETFEIEYLKKNLRLKLRGGKTYNFTEPSGNADTLFVFYREVQAARDRLAKGDKPAEVK
jgi:hypothetical protein